MTITEFLLARIAEDEESARTANYDYLDHWWLPEYADTARMLAECQAKRAIIEEHRSQVSYLVVYRESDRLIAEGYDLDTVPLQAGATMIPACLRHLAAVYADHPDYQPAWAPTTEV